MMSASVCTVLSGSRGSESAGGWSPGQALGDLEPAVDLAQDQQAAVGRQAAAVEAGNKILAGNR